MATAASSSKGQMETNPRGIPKAPFVADVEEYVGGKDAEIQSVMKKFEETTAKYRYMEISLQQRRKALLGKIPDMEQTLQVVKYLNLRRQKALGQEVEEEQLSDDDLDDLDDDDEDEDSGKKNKEDAPMKTLFELNDTLYAEAEISETGEVGLWLGANTMLMYPLQEAIDLLTDKLATAKKSHEETVEDLEWLREQITVMEVNFARVHNWDVKRRRERGLIGQQSGLLPSKPDVDDDRDSDDERD
ncbi:prefoldin subunit [Kwoniella heveanensis BCC8398]|uniref:Prefoldin subunit n=1 Tax=Kwoniella heveanensis BCC8398 TaxID=1296120 RepID=A0A1B9H2Q1_9TREE|nr:prefoldin subunit [Kwoniella heveanensis BCC8398]